MDINLQESFDHHMSVARALGHDVRSEAFHGTIRVSFFYTISIPLQDSSFMDFQWFT